MPNAFRPLIALLGVLLSGCMTQKAPPDSAFQKLSDDFLAGYLAWRPNVGMTLGLHEYDGRVTEFSRASIDAEVRRLERFDEQLARMNPAKLSREKQFDYRLLHSMIRAELFGFKEVDGYRRNPMTYAQAIDLTQYVKRDFAPLANRVKSIVAIEKQTPLIFSAARANLNPVVPKEFIETAIDVAEGQISFLEKDLPIGVKPVGDAKLLAEFEAANRIAITEISNYVAWLKAERLPQADHSFALGPEKFQKMMRLNEFVDLSPQQILEIGMRELKAEQQRFAEAARIIDPSKPAIEVFKAIQKDHPTADGLLPDTRKDLEAIRDFVSAHHIVTIPSEVRIRVEETPPPFRRTSFASMDAPGVFETNATEAYYYVTPTERDWPQKQKDEWLTAFNYYTTDIVTIHEAYPGHYVQFLALKDSRASRLGKITSSYAFVEGWAHYTEQMLLDEGFPGPGTGGTSYASPQSTNEARDSRSSSLQLRAAKYRLAQSDEALLRLCRLCCSIKLHTQGMTLEDATKFFMDNCYYEEKPAGDEARRGTFDPGYLNYTLGKLMILKLRRDWQAQEGARYSLQRFHDELLRYGQPPIPLLRQRMLKDPKLWPQVL